MSASLRLGLSSPRLTWLPVRRSHLSHSHPHVRIKPHENSIPATPILGTALARDRLSVSSIAYICGIYRVIITRVISHLPDNPLRNLKAPRSKCIQNPSLALNATTPIPVPANITWHGWLQQLPSCAPCFHDCCATGYSPQRSQRNSNHVMTPLGSKPCNPPFSLRITLRFFTVPPGPCETRHPAVFSDQVSHFLPLSGWLTALWRL